MVGIRHSFTPSRVVQDEETHLITMIRSVDP